MQSNTKEGKNLELHYLYDKWNQKIIDPQNFPDISPKMQNNK